MSDMEFIDFSLSSSTDKHQQDIDCESKLEDIDIERTFLLTEDQPSVSIYEEQPMDVEQLCDKVEAPIYAPERQMPQKYKAKLVLQ